MNLLLLSLYTLILRFVTSYQRAKLPICAFFPLYILWTLSHVTFEIHYLKEHEMTMGRLFAEFDKAHTIHRHLSIEHKKQLLHFVNDVLIQTFAGTRMGSDYFSFLSMFVKR